MHSRAEELLVERALATTHVEPMPADVLERVAARIAGTLDASAPIERAGRRRPAVWIAAVAAAGIAIVAGLYLRRGEPTPADARAALIDDGAAALAWTATADAAATSATGDVVWSDTQQRGSLRFVGLAVNDPTAWQYQLWIFDRDRDPAYPVDGGVFDVTSTGEVIVPIVARLHVDQATRFAVTVERPGGVVVSKRARIVVTAKPT